MTLIKVQNDEMAQYKVGEAIDIALLPRSGHLFWNKSKCLVFSLSKFSIKQQMLQLC